MVQRVMRQQGAKSPKRKKAPEINAAKMQRVVKRSAILSREYFPKGGRTAMIIDDESIFTLKGDEIQGNDRVWTRDITTCPPDVRFSETALGPCCYFPEGHVRAQLCGRRLRHQPAR